MRKESDEFNQYVPDDSEDNLDQTIEPSNDWSSLIEGPQGQDDGRESEYIEEEDDDGRESEGQSVQNLAEQHESHETVNKTIDIDYAGMLQMQIRANQDDVEYEYVINSGDVKLARNIIFNIRSITSIEQSPVDKNVSRIKLSDTVFIDVNRVTGEVDVQHRLTNFELRLLSQGTENGVPFSREKVGDFKPETDLHTHFAGALRGESLMKVGIAHDIDYPVEYLKIAKINIDNYTPDANGRVKLADLNEVDRQHLTEALSLSQIAPDTFSKMDEKYKIRGPFTKEHPEMFGDLIRELGADYQRTGINYAELSFSAYLSNPDIMQQIEETLPQIEEETGVKMRFIVSLWRHSKKKWNMDESDRMRAIAKSPYIVGCDFMGQEYNSTEDIEEALRDITEYAIDEDPLFSIRVHAGENAIFPKNVKKTLQIVYDVWKQKCAEKGTTDVPMPRLRIGHGLYGVDDETIQLAKEMGVIIEFNMSSNLALNNINGIKDIPIKRYLDAGVDVVLGSDGHGLYSTIGEQESILASVAGLEPEDFAKIHATEQKILAAAAAREQTHTEHDFSALYDVHYRTPDGKPRYSKADDEEAARERAEADHMITERLSTLGIVTDRAEIERVTADKTPILITGASKSSWPEIAPQDQHNIALSMQVLADALNPETAYVVTGGTNFGAEKTMHEAVHRRNNGAEEPLVLLGTLTMQASKEQAAGVEADTITHAQILEVDGHRAQKWLDLPDTQLVYTRERGGYMIALGGGSIVSNMIQRGFNISTKMLLMDGPKGASTEKSRTLRGNCPTFKTASEMITQLYEEKPELFRSDFSLDQLPALVAKAESELS